MTASTISATRFFHRFLPETMGMDQEDPSCLPHFPGDLHHPGLSESQGISDHEWHYDLLPPGIAFGCSGHWRDGGPGARRV